MPNSKESINTINPDSQLVAQIYETTVEVNYPRNIWLHVTVGVFLGVALVIVFALLMQEVGL